MNSESSIPNEAGLKLEGGLRTLGFGKVNSEHCPMISVITVVFNGGKELEETIQSVLNQTYRNLEYIIVDGGSTDNSLEIIRKYESELDYWVSKKDKGIYDAMNKGIELASGNWINFMNCGDRFFSKVVLTNIFGNQLQSDASILFGNWEVRYASGKKRMGKSEFADNLWKGSQFCHQSVFIASSYHKTHPYNYKNMIVADFEFFHSAWKDKQSFKKIDEIVSSIDAGGISDRRRIDVIKGWWQIVDKGFHINLYYSARILREVLVGFIKRFTV